MKGIVKASFHVTAALVLAAMTGTAAQAETEAEFYKGKRIRINIGFPTGGTSDIFARTLARHMGRHLPAPVTFVPQNQPGAGGLKSANYIYNVAPKDGTVFGNFSRSIPLEPLLGKKHLTKFDALKFTWLGSPSQEISTCAAWHTAAVKNLDDIFKKELIVGSTGQAAAATVYPKVFNAVLGTKFKLVLGYTNSVTALAAMEKGEVQGFCAWGWVPMLSRRGHWYKAGKLNVLFQIGLKSHPKHKDVPLILDKAKTEEDRQVLSLIMASQTFARPFVAPPGLSSTRAKTLQNAFNGTVRDPKFVQDAEKQGLEVDLLTGDETLDILKKLYATPKAIVERARAAQK
jgi:tripartite-type tricarboxylate transporter receptor subunit TctC